MEVFELIRPISEHWGFRSASLLAFRTVHCGGDYDLFMFKRAEDGKWSVTLTDVGHRSKRANSSEPTLPSGMPRASETIPK
jgi:hypothetical protein